MELHLSFLLLDFKQTNFFLFLDVFAQIRSEHMPHYNLELLYVADESRVLEQVRAAQPAVLLVSQSFLESHGELLKQCKSLVPKSLVVLIAQKRQHEKAKQALASQAAHVVWLKDVHTGADLSRWVLEWEQNGCALKQGLEEVKAQISA